MALRDYLDILFTPRGGMNSDADPLSKKGGDYGINSSNIHFLTQLGQSTFAVEPTLGNLPKYTLPAVVVQNKIFRIFIQALNGTDTYSLRITGANGEMYAFAAWTSVVNDVPSTYSLAIFAISANLNASLQTYTIGPLTTTSITQGYFEVSVTTIPGWDYQMTMVSVGNTNPLQPIVTQEAIDNSLAGDLRQIGSYDLNGDLLLWSTTQTELPSELPIQNVSASPAVPLIRITVTGHGLTTGDRVVIKGVQINPSGQHEANGQWIVNVIDQNNFDLLGSNFVNPYLAGTGILVINPSGIGEIGVAQRNDNDQTWTYITLLRSKEFNFVTKKQPKTYCERNDILASLYWTDNYNVPRVMYYAGPYMTNGALSIVNVLGEYEYGTIGLETILVRNNNNAHIFFTLQIQSGGNVLAGMHRYPFRFLTENLVPTLWSDLPNPVNVYKANFPVPAQNIFGDNSGEFTGKINQLTITDIPPNLYKYVEIADVYYPDSGVVGTIIGRFLLTQQSTQTFQHTGFETNTQTLDIASLLAIQADIHLALNIDAVNNRLVLSNTTSSAEVDLTPFARSFSHSVIRSEMTGILSAFNGTIRAGEYQDPSNMFFKASYMLNETIRYSMKAKLKNGSYTSNFWIDDVRIDNFLQGGVTPFNRGNPFGDNRRILSLPDMNLTDATADKVYSFGVQFLNIDWNFIIDGQTIASFVDEIVIERVDMIPAFQEVLASGAIALGVSFPFDAGFPGFVLEQFNNIDTPLWDGFGAGSFFTYAGNDNSIKQICDYPYMEGEYLPTGNDNPLYATALDPERRFGSLYMPDLMFNNTVIDFLPSDIISVFGAPTQINTPTGRSALQYNFMFCALKEFTGFTGIDQTDYAIDELVDIQKERIATIAGRQYAKRFIFTYDHPTATGFRLNMAAHITNPTSPVAHTTTTDIAYQGVGQDYGLYNIQYFRAKVNKFGDIAQSKYIPTGAYLNSTSTSVDVFGGDVMTQKTWIKHRVINNVDFIQGAPGVGNDNATFNDGTFTPGCGGGVAIYSQNRVNSQMINRDPAVTSINWQYPASSVGIGTWLYDQNATEPILTYNFGYNIRNGISSDEAYDPNLKRSNRQPARIWWSDIKPENSIVDNYTNFLPLNFKDLQLGFGPIQEHRNVNGQLMSWQDGHYELQYFDATGLLVTNAQEAVLGNAGVMPQRGTTLSTYGTSHGFSVIKGKTQGGKDSVAWISTKYGKVVKHDPSQGTTVISDVQFMRSFFNNNLTFAGLYDTPADGKGIHGVWDDINSEFIWTIVAWKSDVSDWDAGDNYTIGSEVIFGTVGFNEFPQFYVSKTVNSVRQPDLNSDDWTKVEVTDYNFYNTYTVAYNEVKNKFTTFYSFMPKIYSKRGKLFLSPRPIANESIAYEHLTGEYCVWYGDGVTEQAERWQIGGMSINEQPNVDKSLKGMEWQTKAVPDRIDIETKKYTTFMVAADLEARGDQWVVAVRNDSRGTGVNTGDSSTNFGSYAQVGLSGPPRLYNKFINFILKVRAVSRLFNT